MKLLIGLLAGAGLLAVTVPVLTEALDVWIPRLYKRALPGGWQQLPRALSAWILGQWKTVSLRTAHIGRKMSRLPAVTSLVCLGLIVAAGLGIAWAASGEAIGGSVLIGVTLVAGGMSEVLFVLTHTPRSRESLSADGERSSEFREFSDALGANLKAEQLDAGLVRLAVTRSSDGALEAAAQAFEDYLEAADEAASKTLLRAWSTIEDHRLPREQAAPLWDLVSQYVDQTRAPGKQEDWLVAWAKLKQAQELWSVAARRKRLLTALKRAAGLSAAGILALLLSPVIVAFAAIIAARGDHPFYVAHRHGLHYRPFRLYHFTISFDRSPDGSAHPSWFGAFLLRTGLDALPELLNVAKGDMAFVGPRPLSAGHLSALQQAWGISRDELLVRAAVRPGMTGPSQLHSLSDTADCAAYVEMDLDYIRTWTFRRDFVIGFKTALVSFSNFTKARVFPAKYEHLVGGTST